MSMRKIITITSKDDLAKYLSKILKSSPQGTVQLDGSKVKKANRKKYLKYIAQDKNSTLIFYIPGDLRFKAISRFLKRRSEFNKDVLKISKTRGGNTSLRIDGDTKPDGWYCYLA